MAGAAGTLAGRHALVTGGGRGIGRSTASVLLQSGARVTVLGRNAESLQAVVAAGDAHGFVVADVTDGDAVAAACRDASDASGPIDILVANAGAAETGPFLKQGDDVFRRMMDLNFMGVVHAARAVLPGMQERGHGRIIAVASTAGLKGYAYVSAYVAAKHAVVGFVKALALETATKGVTVNAICPGYTETDLVSDSLDRIAAKTGRSRDEALDEILRDKPLKRLIRPDEVASACVWLAGEGAAAVTGSTLVVSGGEI